MQNATQTLRVVSENPYSYDAPQENTASPFPDCEGMVRELDAIFDRIHGGRQVRYSSMR